MSFKEVSYKDLTINPFTIFADEWMLLSSGNMDSFNTMTVSWGHLGAIWGHHSGTPTAIAYVRPQRFTNEFMEREDFFTLSVFDSEYKGDLAYLGSHSGRKENKLSKTKLTPVFSDNSIYFNEAKLVFIMKKIYCGNILENGFLDTSFIDKYYPKRDYHITYYGEIVKVLVKDI